MDELDSLVQSNYRMSIINIDENVAFDIINSIDTFLLDCDGIIIFLKI